MTSKVLKRVSLAATGFTVATLSLSGVASAASISNTGPGSYNSISFGGSNWGGKYSSSQHDYSHKDNKNDKKDDYKNVVKYVVKYDNKDEHKDYHKDKKDVPNTAKHDVLWAITNVASGSSQDTMHVISQNGAQYFLEFCNDPDEDVFAQVNPSFSLQKL